MTAHPQIFAHRGASVVAPENTLPAFAKALDLGADGIELDVQATADGVLVVLHDFSLDRTTTGAGLLRSRTLAQLADVDAGVRFDDSFAGTQIPTLEQVFDLVGDRCIVNVEIKNIEWSGGREVELLARMIQRRDLHDQVIVSSFNPIALQKMRRLDPTVALGLLHFSKPRRIGAAENCIEKARRLSLSLKHLAVHLTRGWFSSRIMPEALHPYLASVDAALVAEAHSRGQLVNVWTVNSVPEARRLSRLGVDAIITDVPDMIQNGLLAGDPGVDLADS